MTNSTRCAALGNAELIGQLPLLKFGTPSMPQLETSRCVARPINYQTAANMVEKYHYDRVVTVLPDRGEQYLSMNLLKC